MTFDRTSTPLPGPAVAPRVAWMESRPATESSTGIFVLRSPASTLCVRAGTHMIVVFRPLTPGAAELRTPMSTPTISTSGLHSFDYSVPGEGAAGWLDVASSRLSIAG